MLEPETLIARNESFNEVELQLITPPPSTDAVLSRSLRGEVFPLPTGGAGAVSDGWGMLQFWALRPKYFPPETLNFVAFANEGGCCDIVRGRYRAGGRVIDLSYTFFETALTLRGYRARKGETPIETVTRAAQEIFEDRVELRLVQLGEATKERPAFGCQEYHPWDPTRRRASYAMEAFCWWVRPQEVGFVTLQIGRNTGSVAVSRDVRMNKYWFKKRMGRGGR